MALTREDFLDDAKRIGCDVAAVRAVAAVESNGSGFNPDGTVKTLFEGHWFHRYTKGAHATSNPDLCFPKWTKQFYGKTWQQEQDRLSRASALDGKAARLSASWGMFQVMGFNHTVCGVSSVEEFVSLMQRDENTQLSLFTSYVINSGISDELQGLDWARFARLYNGPEYQKNAYDIKLANAYAKFHTEELRLKSLN